MDMSSVKYNQNTIGTMSNICVIYTKRKLSVLEDGGMRGKASERR